MLLVQLYAPHFSTAGKCMLYRMDLNFRGTKFSRFLQFDSHPRKFSPAKILTSTYWAANGVHLMNSDVIILQNGYHGLWRSEHRCGVVSNRLCEQTHGILLGTQPNVALDFWTGIARGCSLLPPSRLQLRITPLRGFHTAP